MTNLAIPRHTNGTDYRLKNIETTHHPKGARICQIGVKMEKVLLCDLGIRKIGDWSYGWLSGRAIYSLVTWSSLVRNQFNASVTFGFGKAVILITLKSLGEGLNPSRRVGPRVVSYKHSMLSRQSGKTIINERNDEIDTLIIIIE